MKFEYWVIGKTKEKYFNQAEEEFLKRIKRYTKLNYKIFNDVKASKNEANVLKLKEAEMIINELNDQDYLILMDEKGKEYTSMGFAEKVNSLQLSTFKRVIFLTGGAYGFDESIYQRSAEMLSLSKMTFSHQMVRTFFLEQFYRAFTILNGEKYHNE